MTARRSPTPGSQVFSSSFCPFLCCFFFCALVVACLQVEQVSGVDGASGRTAPARMGRATVAEQVKGQKQGGMRVYICEHNTSPPENQHIKTDQQNILIRSLMLNNNKGGSSSKDVKAAAEGPRKRFAHQSSMVKKYINVIMKFQ
ncbi:hypothetical protein V6Z11_1Z097200 [Gossypium hirsutum]